MGLAVGRVPSEAGRGLKGLMRVTVLDRVRLSVVKIVHVRGDFPLVYFASRCAVDAVHSQKLTILKHSSHAFYHSPLQSRPHRKLLWLLRETQFGMYTLELRSAVVA